MGFNFIKKYCTTVAGFRTVEIRIAADDARRFLINEYVTTRLFSLQQDGMIKALVNKQDVIILVPMRDVTVQELFVEVNRVVFAEGVA